MLREGRLRFIQGGGWESERTRVRGFLRVAVVGCLIGWGVI